MSGDGDIKLELANQGEWQKAFTAYLELSQREPAKALNTKLFYIAGNASAMTPKTDRSTIEKELGVVAYRAIYNHANLYEHHKLLKKVPLLGPFVNKAKGKKGKYVGFKSTYSHSKSKRQSGRDAITSRAAIVHKIINARRGRAGAKGLYGSEMRTAVGKLLSKRFKSTGTLKAGWTGAIRKLASALGFSMKNAGASASVKGTSTATLAKPGLNPVASLTYNTNSFDPQHRPYIDARVRAALEAAYQKELRSMKAYILKKLQPRQERASMTRDDAISEIRRVMSGG